MRAVIIIPLSWSKATPSFRYHMVWGLEEFTTMCSLDQTSWSWESGLPFTPTEVESPCVSAESKCPGFASLNYTSVHTAMYSADSCKQKITEQVAKGQFSGICYSDRQFRDTKTLDCILSAVKTGDHIYWVTYWSHFLYKTVSCPSLLLNLRAGFGNPPHEVLLTHLLITLPLLFVYHSYCRPRKSPAAVFP